MVSSCLKGLPFSSSKDVSVIIPLLPEEEEKEQKIGTLAAVFHVSLKLDSDSFLESFQAKLIYFKYESLRKSTKLFLKTFILPLLTTLQLSFTFF